jgi:hypothetical protein
MTMTKETLQKNVENEIELRHKQINLYYKDKSYPNIFTNNNIEAEVVIFNEIVIEYQKVKEDKEKLRKLFDWIKNHYDNLYLKK